MEQGKKELVLLRSVIKCVYTSISCSNCIYLEECKESAEKKLSKNQKLVISTD